MSHVFPPAPRRVVVLGAGLETAALHGGIVEDGRLLGLATPVNAALIRLAEKAGREGIAPGSMPPETLRGAVRAGGAA